MTTGWIGGARMRATVVAAVLIPTAAAGALGTGAATVTARGAGISAHPGTATLSLIASPTTSSEAPPRFAPLFMGPVAKYTQAQAAALAQNFDVIASQGNGFTPNLSAMRAANPALKMAAYLNGAFDRSSAGNAFPASWYAHDSRGNRIRSVMYGNWLMDPSNPSWHQTVASQCAVALQSAGYDGCFLDTLGLGPLMPGYVTGLPVDPATHKVFTPTTWINAQCATISAVQRAVGSGIVVTNGLADGSKYFGGAGGTTAPILATSHVAMSELWLRVSRNSVNAYPSATSWKQDVDMLVNAESHGWGVLTTTKLWVSASTSQQDAWHRFTLASFLLGAGSHCAYSFSTAATPGALAATSSYDTVPIGSPTGAYSVHGVYYERSYSNGVVVVNPSNSSVTVSFATTFKNLTGSQVRSETLPPHSGDVLVNG